MSLRSTCTRARQERAWNRGGIPHENIADLGPWAHPSDRNFMPKKMDQRITKERGGSYLPTTPDLQCASTRTQTQGSVTRCAQCHRGLRPTTAALMMRAYGQRSKLCWTGSQQGRRMRVVSWQRSRCGWEVWGCVPP